jgi:hypothetical protein
MLLYIAFCLCLVENTASPVRRNNNVNHSVNLIEGEKQWEKVNEKVIPRHLDGVRLERDGNFNKVLVSISTVRLLGSKNNDSCRAWARSTAISTL